MSPLLKNNSRSCVMVSALAVFQQRIVRHSPPLQRCFICSCRGKLRSVALRQGFSSPVGDIGKTDREHYKCVADPQHLPSNGKYHSPQSEYHICQADILLPRPQLCILLLNPSPDYCTPRPSPLTLTHY